MGKKQATGSLRGPLTIFVLGFLALGLSFLVPHQQQTPERVDVVVSVPPLAWAVTALAPELNVKTLVPPGVSPHVWRMSPADARAIESAPVVVLVGLGFEPGVERVLEASPNESRVVFRLGELIEAGALTGELPTHHGVTDPHAWLDPDVMRALVRQLMTTLDDGSPGTSGALSARGAVALSEISAVDTEYTEAIGALPSRTIVTEHNAYGYLALRYGLEVAAVIRPVESVEPSPADVRAAGEALESGGANVIFVEPQFSGEAARRIAERVGAEVRTLDPLGDGDWPAMMRANLQQLVEGLGSHE